MKPQPDAMLQFKAIFFSDELHEKFNDDLDAYARFVLGMTLRKARAEIIAAIEDVLARNLSPKQLHEWWREGRPDMVFFDATGEMLKVVLREAKAAQGI